MTILIMGISSQLHGGLNLLYDWLTSVSNFGTGMAGWFCTVTYFESVLLHNLGLSLRRCMANSNHSTEEFSKFS